MYIDGGRLEVSGDYVLKNPSDYAYAYINMTNEADYVKVGGSFTQHSYYSHEGLLTAGTMEVKGDFTGYSDTNKCHIMQRPPNFKLQVPIWIFLLNGTMQYKQNRIDLTTPGHNRLFYKLRIS
jgi:hypothetical protein